MKTLDEIIRDVTPSEKWDRQRLEQTVQEMTPKDDADFSFLLRSARNFAPLVRALQEAIVDGECYCADHVACHAPCGYCKAKTVLAEALQ